MRPQAALLLIPTVILALSISGCTQESSPSEIVQKKCQKLKVISEEDEDLDEDAQPIARDMMRNLCDDAARDCRKEPGGAACKKALEVLSAAP